MKKTITPSARFFGLKLTTILFTLLLISGQSWGQISITTSGTAVTQNFDGIGTTATAALPSGWKVAQGTDYSLGTTATTLAAGTSGTGILTGTSSGGTYNYANGVTASSTDRAVGFLCSGSYTSPRNLFVQITNNTGATINSFSITFDIEKYRSGSRAWNINFYSSTDGTTWTAQTGGDQAYAADANNTTINNPPTTTSKTVTISGLSIANGSSYYLRWAYTGSGGNTNAQGLGIDNFSVTGTASSILTPPTLTATTSPSSVDNSFIVTYPTDAAFQAAISTGTITIGAATLSYGTDYTVSGNNTITFTPSVSGNSSLRTPGTYTINVNATGYNPATVSQQLTAGAPTTNSTATINSFLAPNFSRTITCTAKDQYNNLVAGYTFKYDAAITNNDATTAESYTIDGSALTSTTNDISVVATTDASGVAIFTAALPAIIDGGDGISIQVQLNNGTTNIGSAFSFLQLTAQTITFGALATVTYGDAPFTVSATGGGSGNPVVFTSSDNNVATCTGTNGETVTIIGYGTCSIYANQAGNGSYNAAIQVEQTLTVNKKELTLPDAAAQNKTYTGTDAAVITGTLTGIVGSDAVTLNGNGYFADVNVNTGIAVTSTCTLGGAKAVNYFLTQPTGLFANITQATQTITFAALANKELGSAPFNLTATATSGQTVSFASSNPGVATILGSQVTIVGIGTTTITASQGGNGNYLPATDVLQPFTVIPATIVAWQFGNPASYGDEIIYNATTNNAMLNTSILSRGSGIHQTTLTRGFASNQWDANATKASAVTTNEYYQFSIKANPAHLVSLYSLNATLRRTATAPNAYIWKYSTDGVNFIEIGSDVSYTTVTDNGDPQAQINLSGIPSLQNVNDATTITFRLYAWGGTSTGATFSFARTASGSSINCLAIGGEAICPTPGTPVFALGATSSRCQGTGSVTYTATSTNSTGIVYTLDAASLAGGNSIVAGSGAVTYSSSWAGTSIITATASGCNGTSIATHTVTVNEAPSEVIVSPSSASICGGSIQSLTASGGTMYSANYTILDENFNGTVNSWTTINNSTGGSSALAAWTLRPDGYEYPSANIWHSNDNSQFYLSNSDIAHPSTTATILQSPAFNTTGNTAVNLSFHHYFNANGLTAKVDYSTDGNNWTNLRTYTNDVGGPNAFVQENISLPPGEPTMYIRFKYDGAWGYFWGLDNVKITGSQFTAPITWTPIDGLYTDAGAITPYTLNTPATTVYARPGSTTTYTATATATPGNGCFNFGISNITVTAPAIADFSYSGTPYCSDAADPLPTYIPLGGPGVFSASPAGLVFISTATGQVDLSASNAGTYTVTNTIAPIGTCPQVVATNTITITTAPTANIHYPGTPFCKTVNSAPVILGGTGSYTGGTFTASSGDLSINSVSGTIDPSNSVAGSYTVTYTIPPVGGGCSPIPVTTQVTITALPIAGFSYAGTPYCSNAGNGSVTFSPGGVPGAFSSGGGLSFSISTGLVNLALSTAGSYTVTNTLPAIGGCPQVIATAPITITTLPTAGISYSGSPWCTSTGVQSVNLSGTTGGTFTAAPSGLAINPTTGAITPGNSNAGTYTVTYTIPASGGCSVVTTNTSVTIIALPIATFSYTGSPYNPTGTALPTLNGAAGVFSSTPGLVFVSTATGEVDLAASTGGIYTVTNTVAAAGGCAEVTATNTIEIIVLTSKNLSLKAIIEGLYVGGGMMHEALDFNDITQDFPMKWGAGIADKVTVTLYDDTYSNIIASYPNVNLNTDGSILIDVASSLVDSYYITIFPRNSVPITTALPQSFAGTSIIYDFTNAVEKAYGVDAGGVPQKDLGDGYFGMYTGELDHDTYFAIDGSDVSILNPDIMSGPYGYLETDLNGDGVVDGSDMSIMDANVLFGPLFWNPTIAK